MTPPKPEKKQPNGTSRWRKETVAPKHFIVLPKALIKGTGKLKLKPHHVWLILALQLEQYGKHPARHYWAELAGWANVTTSTIRRWAKELRALGMVKIKHRHGPRDGEDRQPGYRNDRNEFHMKGAEDAVLAVHEQLIKEKEDRRQQRRGSGES
jgi:hypothetical protein